MIKPIARFIAYWMWRLKFLFKPTYYVFTSLQEAIDALPKRGGTIMLGPHIYNSVTIKPGERPLRLVGGKFLSAGRPCITVPFGSMVEFSGCVFKSLPGTTTWPDIQKEME